MYLGLLFCGKIEGKMPDQERTAFKRKQTKNNRKMKSRKENIECTDSYKQRKIIQGYDGQEETRSNSVRYNIDI